MFEILAHAGLPWGPYKGGTFNPLSHFTSTPPCLCVWFCMKPLLLLFFRYHGEPTREPGQRSCLEVVL